MRRLFILVVPVLWVFTSALADESTMFARVRVGRIGDKLVDNWVDVEVRGDAKEAAAVCDALVSAEVSREYPAEIGFLASVVQTCGAASLPAVEKRKGFVLYQRAPSVVRASFFPTQTACDEMKKRLMQAEATGNDDAENAAIAWLKSKRDRQTEQLVEAEERLKRHEDARPKATKKVASHSWEVERIRLERDVDRSRAIRRTLDERIARPRAPKGLPPPECRALVN